MKRSFIFLFNIFLVFNTFLFAKAPLWYQDLESAYPSRQYIAQVGYGKDKKDAQLDAVSAISKFFNTQVKVNVEAQKTVTLKDKGMDVTGNIDEKTMIQSKVDLFAVEYSKPYFDKSTRLMAVVAYIDRAKAWQLYKSQMEFYSSSFLQAYDGATSKDDKLTQYLLLSSTKKVAKEFIVDYQFVMLLFPKQCEDSYLSTNKKAISLSTNLSSLKMECSMKINVQNDYNNIIERKIVALLSAQGFAVSKKDALYEVNASFVYEIINEKTDIAETFTSYPSIEIIIQNKGSPLFSYSKACTKTVTFKRQKNLTLGYQKITKILDESFIKELSAFLVEQN